MKIEAWDQALDHLCDHLERTTPAGDMPLAVKPLPGETFYDPTGWRFALVYDNGITITRVGPRGGIEPLWGTTRSQLTYLLGLLPRRTT